MKFNLLTLFLFALQLEGWADGCLFRNDQHHSSVNEQLIGIFLSN
jgi:hypothetical protein